MIRTLLTAFFLLTPFMYAQDAAEDTWKKALKFYEDAEERIRKGGNSEAVVLLNTTIETLREIQYNYPKWNPSVVRARLTAAQKRVEDVEKLILAAMSGLDREQLLEKLKETQISKAKFSKAMMIIYDQLKDTQEVLKSKSEDLAKAQKALGKKLIDQEKVDELTLRNLKMKKTLSERDAKIKLLQTRLAEAKKDSGTNKMQALYEQKLLAMNKKEKEIEQEKQDFLREKKKMAEALKEMSLKYREVTIKEKNYEDNLEKLADEISKLKKQLTEETTLKKKFSSSSENLADKLELASKRLAELEAREKKLVLDVQNLRKGKELNIKAMAAEKEAAYKKEINYLKKVEIDLKSKLDTASAESEKNKKLLESYMAENGPEKKKSKELEKQIAYLKKAISKKDSDDKVKNTQMISMSSEIVSLKAQLKLQANIVDSLKKRLSEKAKQMPAPVVSVKSEADTKLIKAYEKSEIDLKSKLKMAEKKIADLQRRNETLRKENLLGDEEMIRKYVQVRNELKAYKAKTREIFSKYEKEGKKDAIMEAAFSEDERKEQERIEKLRNLLFNAHKAEKAKNYQAALGLYTEVLHIEPKNFDALFRIGLIHYNRRHFQDAAVHLKKAFYQQPDDKNILLALGLSYLEQEKIELAVSYLSRLVGLKPNDSLARLQLGVSLQGLGWTEAAFEQLKKSCELDSENAEAAFNLAMVSLALPEPKVAFAKANYERAVKLGVARDSQLETYFKNNSEK